MSREFTLEEKEKLVEFRKKVKDVLTTEEQNEDHYLIRWLRARSLDIEKAEQMLRTSLKWRADNNVDGILDREDVPDKYKKIYCTATLGSSKAGDPLIMFPLGRFNHRIAIEAEGLQKFLRYNIIWVEAIMKIVKDHEKSTGIKGLQIVELVDMENYSFKELTYGPGREFIVETQKVFEANYPEMLKSLVIINAPKVFAMLYSITKPLLPKETLDKVDIYGPNEETWKEVIKQRFNVDKIPVRWGGTLTGSDIFCSQDTSVWMDGPIPLDYFTGERTDEDGLKVVKVGARDKLKLTLDVKVEGSELKWKFKTENHDIGFQVRDPSGNIVIPWARVDSHNRYEEDALKTDQIGKYHITFDNSFSYTKSKQLSYSVEIIEPFISDEDEDVSN